MNPFLETAKPVENAFKNWLAICPKPYNKNEQFIRYKNNILGDISQKGEDYHYEISECPVSELKNIKFSNFA